MMGKELIVLFFGWELWVELGFSSSTGIQSALQEQVICCLQDKQTAFGKCQESLKTGACPMVSGALMTLRHLYQGSPGLL